ncbi:hypothetical protein AB7225_22225, partial [Escherichia coli]
MTHDEPCSMAPDDKHDLISGTCSHLPKIKRKMPYAGCRYRVFIGKLCVIATLPSVIRKRRTGILINIISLGAGVFYNQYDELNIIFFIRVI